MFLPTNTGDMDAALYCSHHLCKARCSDVELHLGLFSFVLSKSYDEKGTPFY